MRPVGSLIYPTYNISNFMLRCRVPSVQHLMLECFLTDMWLRYNVCFITVTEEVVILNSYYSHIYKYICICIFKFGQISIPECAKKFQTYCGVIHDIPYCILKMLPNIWVSQLPRGVHFSFFKPEKHMFS